MYNGDIKSHFCCYNIKHWLYSKIVHNKWNFEKYYYVGELI